MPDPRRAAGCVPLRPLGVGEILDGSVRAIRRNPRTLLGVSAPVAVVRGLGVAALQLTAFRDLDQLQIQAVSMLVVDGVLGGLLSGPLTIAITQDVLGVRLGAGAIWRQLRGRVWALLRLSMLVTLGEDVGLVALIVPGVLLWGLWAVSVPALMVERIGVRQAFARSTRLVAGSFWRVWLIRALGYLVAMFLAALITVPFGALAVLVSGNDLSSIADPSGTMSLVYVAIATLGAVLGATLTAPLRAGIDALLYVDLRMRKEGMDLALAYGIGAPTVGASR